MAGKITVYISSVTGNMEIKKQQQKISMVLDGKKIAHEEIDISTSDDHKTQMRDMAGDPKMLPPVICNGDQYCGDFAMFDEAVENETLNEFLKLE